MQRIGLRELRQEASDYVRRAEAGEEFEVTVAGRPAARLVGAAPAQWRTWEQAGDALGSLGGAVDDDETDLRDAFDDTLRDPWERG